MCQLRRLATHCKTDAKDTQHRFKEWSHTVLETGICDSRLVCFFFPCMCFIKSSLSFGLAPWPYLEQFYRIGTDYMATCSRQITESCLHQHRNLTYTIISAYRDRELPAVHGSHQQALHWTTACSTKQLDTCRVQAQYPGSSPSSADFLRRKQTAAGSTTQFGGYTTLRHACSSSFRSAAYRNVMAALGRDA
jgi:hypothetical protein